MRWLLSTVALLSAAASVEIKLPNTPDSVRFAVIGDSGTGHKPQYETAATLFSAHSKFPFTFVLMAGDNLYGGETPDDFLRKFERPYQELLQAGVKFHASLGNHDRPNQRAYKLFGMNGERYYTFEASSDVRFFALDSNYMDRNQLEWLQM